MIDPGPDALLPRRAMTIAAESLQDFRIVMVHGPRQAGRTTLAPGLGRTIDARYVSLDNDDDRATAAADGRTFLDELPHGFRRSPRA